MPELPEVETIVRQLAPRLTGRRVKRIDVLDPLLKLTPPNAHNFVITLVTRVGKEAAIELMPPSGKPLWVVFHLRMTGGLVYSEGEPLPAGPPLRARLELDIGSLNFLDVRRLGTMRIVPGPVEAAGLDPMSREFTAVAFAKLLDDSKTPIKPWLMRQDRLAGIGNIYASEALFAAQIDPRRPAGSLTKPEIMRLRQAICKTLKSAIRASGTTFSNYRDANGESGRFVNRLKVYGKQGQSCPRCATPIARIVQTQRSTFFCPHCQL